MRPRGLLMLVSGAGLGVAALALAPVQPRRYVLQRSQLVPRPPADVVPFFEDPHNLAVITPPDMAFELLSIDGLPVRTGTRIEYRIRIFGMPQRWVAEIAEYDAGRRFVDVQAQGPYRSWRHEHSFDAHNGGTLTRDRVEYELPFGMLGRIVHKLVVERQLQRIFEYRRRVIEDLFGPPAGG